MSRPKGPKKMPELMPQTVAMLVGRHTIDAAGHLLAVGHYTDREESFRDEVFKAGVDPILARLLFDIRYTRDQIADTPSRAERKPLQEVAARKEKKFARASEVAASIGDIAFFQQVTRCLETIEKQFDDDRWHSREVSDYPLRELVRVAQRRFKFDACTANELKNYLSEITDAKFDAHERKNALRAMGLLKSSKGGE